MAERRGARAAKQHRLGTLDHTMQLVLLRCRAVGSCVGTPAAVLFIVWTRRERMSRGCMDSTILGVSSGRVAHQVLKLDDLRAGAIAAPTGTAAGVDGRGVEPVGGPVVARGWRCWRVAKMAPGSFRSVCPMWCVQWARAKWILSIYCITNLSYVFAASESSTLRSRLCHWQGVGPPYRCRISS